MKYFASCSRFYLCDFNFAFTKPAQGNMNKYSGLLYLLCFGAVSYISVEAGLFDSSYSNVERLHGLSEQTWPLLWKRLHLSFLIIPAILCCRGLWKTQTRKITVLDFHFLVVFSGFTFMEVVGSYLIYVSYFQSLPEEEFLQKVLRIRAYTDWATLPMLAWIVAWSRHVRRGWYQRRNVIVFGLAVVSFMMTIIHSTMYAFLICIVGVLSNIAVYEFYKIHFFRSGVKSLFWIIIVSNVLFCASSLYGSLLSGGWTLVYINTISLVCMTTTVSVMFVKVLEEINEHKF